MKSQNGRHLPRTWLPVTRRIVRKRRPSPTSDLLDRARHSEPDAQEGTSAGGPQPICRSKRLTPLRQRVLLGRFRPTRDTERCLGTSVHVTPGDAPGTKWVGPENPPPRWAPHTEYPNEHSFPLRYIYSALCKCLEKPCSGLLAQGPGLPLANNMSENWPPRLRMLSGTQL